MATYTLCSAPLLKRAMTTNYLFSRGVEIKQKRKRGETERDEPGLVCYTHLIAKCFPFLQRALMNTLLSQTCPSPCEAAMCDVSTVGLLVFTQRHNDSPLNV
jgi:hypothetical protein